ncbi:MAG: hypothetical protein WCT28_00845 [Patescibacteria group bacterium]|jgi:hypothetical protein
MASKQKSRKKLSVEEKLTAAAERKNKRLMAKSHVVRDVSLFPMTEVRNRADFVWLAGGPVPSENVFSCPETVPLDQRGAICLFERSELLDFVGEHHFVGSGWQIENCESERVEDRLIDALDEQKAREIEAINKRKAREEERAHRAFYFLVPDGSEHFDFDESIAQMEERESDAQQALSPTPSFISRIENKTSARFSSKARRRRYWNSAVEEA